MDIDLKNKVAVITGASSGIGEAIASSLACEGVHTLLVGRDMARLREIASACTAQHSMSSCYHVDLLSPEQIRRFGRQAMRDWEHIDFLIHSAGIIKLSTLEKAELQDLDLQYQCNVRAPFALTQVLLPALIQSRGQVVFINSTSGLTASAGLSQYSASKYALRAIADSFREELNPLGVRVVSFYLGRTATPMQAQVHKDEGKHYRPEYLIQPEQVSSAVIQALRIGREAEIMDVRIRPFHKPDQSGNPL